MRHFGFLAIAVVIAGCTVTNYVSVDGDVSPSVAVNTATQQPPRPAPLATGGELFKLPPPTPRATTPAPLLPSMPREASGGVEAPMGVATIGPLNPTPTPRPTPTPATWNKGRPAWCGAIAPHRFLIKAQNKNFSLTFKVRESPDNEYRLGAILDVKKNVELTHVVELPEGCEIQVEVYSASFGISAYPLSRGYYVNRIKLLTIDVGSPIDIDWRNILRNDDGS